MKQWQALWLGAIILAAGSGNLAANASNPLQAWVPEGSPYCSLEITLRSGEELRCFTPQPRVQLNGTTASGAMVQEKLDHADINWDANKQLFVIRTVSWTGELTALWESLSCQISPDNTITIQGNEIQSLHIRYHKAAEPANGGKQ